MFSKRLLLTCLLMALYAVRHAWAETQNPFFTQLESESAKIVAELHALGIRNVGVLKFSVQRGNLPAADNAGALNYLAAQRLERAMVQANESINAPLTIALDATRVASLVTGGSHRSDKGRERLFTARYPSDSGPVHLDGLITARITLVNENRTTECHILVIPRSGPARVLRSFQADTDLNLLHELGFSFASTGRIRRGGPLPFLAEDSSQRIELVHPMLHGPMVTWTMFYDGQPVELRVFEDRAVVTEPRPDQKVTMVLERSDDSTQPLGVVLKVNGRNTINREQLPSVECSKWILDDTTRRIEIRGFQRDNRMADEFVVKAERELPPGEVNYSDELGAVSLAVYQVANERTTDPGVLTRGIITNGPRQISQPIRYVKHHWDPAPLMSAIVWYSLPVAN